jgi:hypothetical protein
MTIMELIAKAHDTAKSKGWWEGVDLSHPDRFPALLALVHSEVSEALEAYRSHLGIDEILFPHHDKNGNLVPEGVAVELADVIIRIADLCGAYKIPLHTALQYKMDYNKTRSYKHGGKVL